MDIGRLVAGIAVAAVSALTYLAYKHPHAYIKIYWAILGAMSLALVGILVWNVASSETFRALDPYLDADQINAARLAADRLTVPAGWALICYVGILLYLAFLTYLPTLLRQEKTVEPQDQKKDE